MTINYHCSIFTYTVCQRRVLTPILKEWVFIVGDFRLENQESRT
jgi:hypothetical protein